MMTDTRERPRQSLRRSASVIAAANVMVAAVSLVSAPLQARALGAEGRGYLAAIVVTVVVAAQLSQAGLGEYMAREVARGRHLPSLFSSLLPVAVGLASVASVALLLLAAPLSGGNDQVEQFVRIGALLLPLSGIAVLGVGLASGLQRWTLIALVQAAPAVVIALTLVLLYALGALTLAAAAIATLGAGLLSVIPVIVLGRRLLPFARPDRGHAIRAISYSMRSLPGVLAALLNGRLDQLLMVALSSPRELGLYAIAVTLAGAPGLAIGALASVIFPRVAAGEVELVARASRLSLAATIVIGVLVAIISYPTLRFLFGMEFVGSVPMVLILLLSGLPAGGSLVLGYSLRSLGRPGTVSAVDAFGLAVTLPGAFVLIPSFGGVGAALVTLSANLVIFLCLLETTHRILGLSRREYLHVGPEELQESMTRLVDPIVGWFSRTR